MKDVLNSGLREKFISSAKNSKILVMRCTNCKTIILETMVYCTKCQNNKFDVIELDGIGKVITFTIHAVPPEGFDDVESYAWVVFSLEGAPIRVSGFLPGIKSPSDLPIGSKVKVAGFDEKHGLVIKKI